MLGAVVAASSSCKKFLDINTNPNSLTQATPALVLPQAITGAASITNTFSQSFSDNGGFQANAGGFGGFGTVVTWDYTTSSFTGLWTSTYDNANDFQYIIDNTAGEPLQVFSTSIARIMKSFAFERLVNQYNDVPYSQALKGAATLAPKYDKAEDVYKGCIAELDKAMADITAGLANAAVSKIVANTDPLFAGDMNLWRKFANTIKLRMLIKMAGVPAQASYATSAFGSMNTTTIGFLTTDAINQPTYEKTNRPSPIYNSLGFNTAGNNVNTSRIPTRWIMSFYDGGKLTDPGRGSVIYRSFPNTPKNQMGDESTGVPAALSAGSAWFTGNKDAVSLPGVVKGPAQGQPVMLAAEAWFLQAEAYARGYLTGDAEAAFYNGITQSFNYLYKNATGVVDAAKNVTADVNTYRNANSISPLVNFSLATTLDAKIEAIITQKYIALNMINNDEAFNEFRRTNYPRVVNGSNLPLETFASRQSVSTRPDRMLGRVLYPQEEYNLNPTNAPAGINKFSSTIFWEIN